MAGSGEAQAAILAVGALECSSSAFLLVFPGKYISEQTWQLAQEPPCFSEATLPA